MRKGLGGGKKGWEEEGDNERKREIVEVIEGGKRSGGRGEVNESGVERAEGMGGRGRS